MKNFFLTLLITCLPVTVFGEQFETFGNYTVHYSAFTTDILTPAVAKSYQIQRSKNRIMVNLSIMKDQNGDTGKSVRTRVEGTATNLNQQLRALNIREIVEQDAIYYIADTPIDNTETLKFNFIITPEGEKTPYTLSFQEQFYTE